MSGVGCEEVLGYIVDLARGGVGNGESCGLLLLLLLLLAFSPFCLTYSTGDNVVASRNRPR